MTNTKKPIPKPTHPFKFTLDQWVLHLETQGRYVISGLPDEKLIKTESGWKPAYGYRSEQGGPEFFRAQDMMEDGRFVVTNAP